MANDDPAWTGAPRALIVAVSPSPTSGGLVVAGHRLASQFGVAWAAVHVASGAPLDDASRQRLEAHLALAQSLGGDIVRLASARVGEALAREARARGPGCLAVVGRPPVRAWGRSDFASIVRATRGIDLLLVDRPGASISTVALPERRGRLWDLVLASLAVASVTAIGMLARAWLSDADVVMSYLLVVVLLAWRRGRTASTLAALGAVAAYNVGFVAPVGSLTVADPRNLLTFAVLLTVAWTVSTLTTRLRDQERAALGRERRTSVLLAWTRAFSSASSQEDVLAVLTREATEHLARTAEVRPVTVGTDEPRAGEASAAQDGTAQWTLGHAGILVLSEPRSESSDLAEALVRLALGALSRIRQAEAAEAAQVRARTEELRSALLASLSHDLRTPLAAITGSAAALLDPAVSLAEPGRDALVRAIHEEGTRLARLVGNLLEMGRLSSAPTLRTREWVPLDELIGAAMARVEPQLEGRAVDVLVDEDVPGVCGDPTLLVQLVVNLLDNAVRHTPRGTAVELRAQLVSEEVCIRVRDQGPGLGDADPARLFEPFVRGSAPPAVGTGLGLAIARGIAQVHGGTIAARSHPDGGAEFIVRLAPCAPPPVPPSMEAPS